MKLSKIMALELPPLTLREVLKLHFSRSYNALPIGKLAAKDVSSLLKMGYTFEVETQHVPMMSHVILAYDTDEVAYTLVSCDHTDPCNIVRTELASTSYHLDELMVDNALLVKCMHLVDKPANR